MAKLIVLALAFTALLAFASAHKTIVTTTTIQDDDNTFGRQQQCSQVEDQSFNQCDRYFQSKAMRSPFEKRGQEEQGQGLGPMCCQELENVDEQCQCQAVKKVMRDAMMTQQQQQRQGGSFSGEMIERLKQKAEKIISKCNLQITRQECQIGTISTTTMITDEEENPTFPPRYGTGSQQCWQMIPQRFNQCERFIEQALQSGSPRILMSINKQHGQQPQQMQKLQQQCCNELENVQQDCHCEALQKVYEQAMQQQQGHQQQGRQQHHQGSRQGGQMQQQVQQVVQVLKNQCDLQAQQCMIPSAMF